MDHLGDCWFFTAVRLFFYLFFVILFLYLWMLVTNIHSHTYIYHIHIHISPFNIPRNGYYVIIIENNFLHIKHLIREIWIEGMKVTIAYIVYSWGDGGLNQGHLWISVIFGCHNFGGCIWYLGDSWLLLIILQYTGQVPTLNN